MQLDIASATVLAAGIGAVVAGGVSAINSWFIRRSEERKQIRELAVRAAIEDWKFQIEVVKNSGKGTIKPLDLFLIHAMYFIQALDGSLRTEDKIREHLRRASSITDAAIQEINDCSNKQHENYQSS